ncbi:30S ribosomal protein S2 [Patescibacteria group bacterium]|nr:30S ribosomal protein S2 [Patescibacteria group bacterium]
MAIPTIPEIRELVEAGMHFGHSSGKWHPKMKPYIFATRDKLHIIDLEKTRQAMEKVLTALEERIRDGKTVVLVGTKKRVGDLVKEVGEATGTPYVNVRWLGGTLTNWSEMQKSIARMKKMEAFLETEEAEKMIKKERVRMESELERMHHKFGGLRNLTKIPHAILVIDSSFEHNAVKEARLREVEIFGIVDTNCNPDLVDHLIPANDDAPKSLKLLMRLIRETIENGQKLISIKQAESKKADDAVTVEIPEEIVEAGQDIEEEIREEVSEEKQKKPAVKDEKGFEYATKK